VVTTKSGWEDAAGVNKAERLDSMEYAFWWKRRRPHIPQSQETLDAPDERVAARSSRLTCAPASVPRGAHNKMAIEGDPQTHGTTITQRTRNTITNTAHGHEHKHETHTWTCVHKPKWKRLEHNCYSEVAASLLIWLPGPQKV